MPKSHKSTCHYSNKIAEYERKQERHEDYKRQLQKHIWGTLIPKHYDERIHTSHSKSALFEYQSMLKKSTKTIDNHVRFLMKKIKKTKY